MRRLVLLFALVAGVVLAPAAGAAIAVSITSPADGSHSLSGVVPVSIDASADAGIYSVQLEVDGVLYGLPDTTTVGPYQYEIDWDTTRLPSGNHTLAVVATDWSQIGGGVQQTSTPVTVDVGPAYPTVSLTVPQAYTFQRGMVALAATVSGGQAPTSVVYAVDGNPLTGSAWNTTTSADGAHTVSATVTDGRGKTATDSVPVTVDNTPPATYLISPSAGNYFQGSLPDSAHADDAYGIASVQFQLDGSPAGAPVATPDASGGGYTYSASLDISSLSKGSHTLTEVATDSAGNTSASAPVTFEVGVVPPQVSLSAPPDWTFARGTVQVTASPSGGTEPYSLQFSVDGVAAGSPVTSAPYSFRWDTTKLADGPHTLSVSLTDSDGTVASSAVVHQTVDNTPPSTYLISPAPGGYFDGTLAVSAHASDASGVGAVQFAIDGNPAGPLLVAPDTAGGYTYSASLDISKLALGQHTLTEIASDSAGNTTTTAPSIFTIAPAGALQVKVAPPSDWTFARGTETVTASPAGGNGPYSVQFSVDGAATGSPVTSAPYSFNWDTTKASDGTHALTAIVTDHDGDTATSLGVHQTVDNTPPSTFLISPAAGGYVTGALAVSAHASDASGIATVQYQIDGSPAGTTLIAPDAPGGYTYSASLDISKLAPGKHILAEIATDNAGNTATSAPVSFGVGVGPGTVKITSPANATYGRKTVTVTATVTGGTPPFSGTLAVDGTPTTLLPTVTGSTLTFALDTTKLAAGSHSLAVTVTDGATLSSTSPAVSLTVDNAPPIAVMYQPTPLAGYSYARSNGPTTFQVHASDAYGVKSVQFTVDGSPVGALLTKPDTSGGYLYSLTFDTSTLKAGMHLISALVTDNAGNTTNATALSLKSGPIVYVPVLNYHGIEGPLDSEPDIYDQTSAQADAELSYLKTNGYQSITLAQYETWLQTGTLPVGITKPVVITVDDGLTDELAWDPLLQKYGFKAVLYVVTGFADNTTPGADDPTGNMSWAQIQALAADGRWTIAFHAGQYGHGDYSDPTTTIKLSSTQTQSYATSCWTYYNCLGTVKTTTTTGSGRTLKTTTTTAPETPAQFESQVSAEVTAGMAELKQKVPSADMTSWACPWNACGQWTNFYNDASGTIQSWFPSFMASKFQVVFMQTDPITFGLASGTVGPLNGDNRHYRFEVHTDTTAAQFATALTDPAFANN